jgi:hypothetical protein
MIRKLKTLGLAMLAVLALSAIFVSAVQAANFTASSYPTSFTGESSKGNDTFTTEAGTVECKTHFSGTLTSASERLELTAVPSECQAFGFLSAEVTRFNCKTVVWFWGLYEKTTCEKEIIHAGSCTIAVPSQVGLSKVDLTNSGSGDILMQATVQGIAYEVTKDGFGCPFNGTGKKTGATYKQHSAITLDSTNGASLHIG